MFYTFFSIAHTDKKEKEKALNIIGPWTHLSLTNLFNDFWFLSQMRLYLLFLNLFDINIDFIPYIHITITDFESI